ncbi:MAG: UDP-N-acetylmuramate dehydrogenase [Candidatus Moranbacteria bacterium]|nr:UDP-N-acetylmuramate dehydrogenase [Candidatus Moranbacteria bacterium]
MYEIKENFNVGALTTFKVDAKAKYYVVIQNLDDIEKLFREIKQSGLPYFFLGGGSNTLFNSAGYNGWVINLMADQIETDENLFDVEAGCDLNKLIKTSIKAGYAGLHKLIGIPGTVAGAIRGNAGAFGQSISSFVKEVLFFDCQRLNFGSLDYKQCHFQYRQSVFSTKKHFLILRARLELKQKATSKLDQEIKQIKQQRKNMIHYKFPSAGSVFKNIPLEQIKKNPHYQGVQGEKELKKLIKEYYYDRDLKKQNQKISDIKVIPAGYLIEKVGLAGRIIGRAEIPQEHCNVIYNLGKATSNEIIQLMSFAKARVRDEYGILLNEELVFVS